MQRPPRILFIAESVTLAHLARPLSFARRCAGAFEVTVAAGSEWRPLVESQSLGYRALKTIPGREFLARVASGARLYADSELEAYVAEDLFHLDEVRPDLVVGDFRFSLQVSARLRGIPYACLANAYWSPYARIPVPLQEHPLANVLGPAPATALFRLLQPLIFAYHALPLDRLRRRHGLPRIGLNLRRAYTDADYVLYADLPELAPMQELPAHHRFIGPPLWSPSVPLPAWWDDLAADRPLVYVTLGSSGRGELLPIVLDGLRRLPVTAIVATAGKAHGSGVQGNAYITDFLPGDQAARRADLVISNGGSLTSYQAFAEGKPVIGIADNIDQHFNMWMVERAGVGKLLRSGRLTPAAVAAAAQAALHNLRMRERVGALRASLLKSVERDGFGGFLHGALGTCPAA